MLQVQNFPKPFFVAVSVNLGLTSTCHDAFYLPTP
jgi:hypothetical protein